MIYPKKMFNKLPWNQYVNGRYPIERSRNAGAKPRNIEVSLDNRPVAENSGSTIEKPKTKSSKSVR